MTKAIITSGFCGNISGASLCKSNDSVSPTSIDKKLLIRDRPAESDGPRDASRFPDVEEVTETGEASPAPGTPKFTPQDESGSNNILAYVSVLAAVVLGLLIYVAYKW